MFGRGRGESVFHVFAGVELAVDVPQALVGHMGVYLGRGNIFVSEEFLDGPQVDSLAQEIRGIAVPQSMGRGEERDIG